MAKVRHNLLFRGTSGMVGDQFVIRVRPDGKIVVADRPTINPNRESTLAQLKQQQEFSEAVAYAKNSKDDPAYVEIAEQEHRNARNIAFADWFHAPEILDIDLSAWDGKADSLIRIKAVDYVQVKLVTVVITDSPDVLLDQGGQRRVRDRGGNIAPRPRPCPLRGSSM